MSDLYQTITLTLTDGREVSYTGRAQMSATEPERVIGIKVSLPIPLPHGMFFDTILTTKENE